MKKLLLIAGLAVFTLSTQAQEIQFGAKAGLNMATIGGDETGDIKSLTSFHVGGVVEIPVSEKFSVQPELLYSSQGAKQEYSETEMGITVKATAKLKLNYINLPVMAKYYVVDGLAIEAGPQIGFLMSAKTKAEIDIDGDLPQEFIDMIKDEFGEGEEDVKEFYQTLDFGLGLGASYKLDMGVFFGARYTLGLSNIYKDSGDYKNQNNVFQFSVGYMF